MKRLAVFSLALFAFWAAVMVAQNPNSHRFPKDREDPLGVKLPNGKSQRDEMVKEGHKKDLENAAELARLANELKEEVEASGNFVVSVKTLKKLDDIEKLTRSIRGRLKRN
jgi:hypothetical protein